MSHPRQNRPNPKVCHFHDCKVKNNLEECQYCNSFFCSTHIRAKRPGEARFRSSKIEDKEFMDEWRDPNTHPCLFYTAALNEKNRMEEQLRRQAFSRPSFTQQDYPPYKSEEVYVETIKPAKPVSKIKSTTNKTLLSIPAKQTSAEKNGLEIAELIIGIFIVLVLIFIIFFFQKQ